MKTMSGDTISERHFPNQDICIAVDFDALVTHEINTCMMYIV